MTVNDITGRTQNEVLKSSPGLVIEGSAKETFAGKPLVFPSDLSSFRNKHIMQFRSYNIFNEAKTNKGTDNKSISAGDHEPQRVDSIYLPTPGNVSAYYSSNYSTLGRGQFSAGLGSGEIVNSFTGKDFVEGLKAAAGDAASTVAGGTQQVARNLSQPQVLERIAREMAMNVAGNATSEPFYEADANARGIATRNYEVSTFRGMSMRQFSYGFRLIARNEQESREVDNIVLAFKKGMHPGISGDTAKVNYPYQWTIQFIVAVRNSEGGTVNSRQNFYMYQPGVCYLTDVGVTYNGSGVPAFFKGTHAPVEVDLTLQFVERDILVRENFETRDEPAGVNNSTAQQLPASQRLRSAAF